ncbi:MAG TPA: metal ABC transporter ATP-binding protein [Vicinamibacteria bacterium]|nr:metal ABC transporter ATP-binding protein [Vicinamibacteria bacterium]
MTAALRARGVVVALGGRRVLDDVSFEVERGEFACLCGPNGGGKTTFLKAALGLLPLSAGEIEVLGSRPGAAGSAVGYLPQAKSFNPAFPARVVDVIVANRRGSWPVRTSEAEREAARSALARVGGESLIDAGVRGLSGGELQRAYLARALVNDPALLLLDEPTAGVDARGRTEFLDLLAGMAARGDLAAVLVTHNAAAVRRLARRVVYIDGRVRAWGPPAEVLDREWDRPAFGGHDHDAPPCEDE